MKSTKKIIPAGSQMEFIFPEAYDSLLTTYDKTIKCASKNFIANCYVENGKKN